MKSKIWKRIKSKNTSKSRTQLAAMPVIIAMSGDFLLLIFILLFILFLIVIFLLILLFVQHLLTSRKLV
jgi:hypothetical protein